MAQSDPLTTTGGNASLKAKRFDWKNDPLTSSVIVILVAGGAVALAILFFDVNPTKVLAFVILLAISAVVVVLSLRFKIVDRGVQLFFGACIWFGLWVTVSLLPLLVFRILSEYILTNFSLLFQVAAFAVWGLLLAGTLLLIATESNRNLLFRVLQNIGGFAPVIYSLNVLLMALVFFAAVTYILATHEVLTLSSRPPGRQVEMGSLVEFYLWHFLKAVPLLEVNQTLGWDEPWTYSASVGWIVLLFKLVVIVPVIGAFVGYWKFAPAQHRATRRRVDPTLHLLTKKSRKE